MSNKNFDDNYKKALKAANVTDISSKRKSAPTPKSSGIPSESEYERQELTRAGQRLDEIRRAPLSDRKEAQAEFGEAIANRPDDVAERIGWLLDGNYGQGELMKAKQIVNTPRMNQPAALTHMIAAFEWQCPYDNAVAAWKKLTAAQKAKLQKAVERTIKDHKAAQE